MEDYVKPTEFCDCDSEEITRKAEELTKNVSSPKEAAVAIFNEDTNPTNTRKSFGNSNQRQ
jgi:hypothetical protein